MWEEREEEEEEAEAALTVANHRLAMVRTKASIILKPPAPCQDRWSGKAMGRRGYRELCEVWKGVSYQWGLGGSLARFESRLCSLG